MMNGGLRGKGWLDGLAACLLSQPEYVRRCESVWEKKIRMAGLRWWSNQTLWRKSPYPGKWDFHKFQSTANTSAPQPKYLCLSPTSLVTRFIYLDVSLPGVECTIDLLLTIIPDRPSLAW